MKGIPLHPLRLRALDRMTVLRMPFMEQPPDDSWFVGIGRSRGNPVAIFQAGATQYPVRLPYAPGDYFVREAWDEKMFSGFTEAQGEYDAWGVIYKADYPQDRKVKWQSARSMPAEYARYLLTIGPPVPCRLGEVGMKEAIAEGWDGNIHCDYYDEWHIKTWNTLYPKHPYSPDRWTWGYPMEVRKR